MVKFWTFGLVVLSTILGAYAGLLLKFGAQNLTRKLSDLIQNWRLVCGIALYVVSAALFIAAVKFENLSILYPITSMTYIWVMMIGKRHLNESYNRFKWLGLAFIVVGVSMLALK